MEAKFKVIMGEGVHKFNVELATDVKTFHHDAYSITDTEISEGVIKVVEKRKSIWGTAPRGFVDGSRQGQFITGQQKSIF